ncbi:beta strand repeat-containing protein [Methylobacterium radiodurans]|nr:DUF4214 domain-containing protein [Methylobacterium radiodurans]
MALSAAQLNTIYQNVLFRNADTAGIQFFANRTDISDAQVRQQIELSAEATQFISPIVRLYQTVLGRVPDQDGLRFFSFLLRQGSTLEAVTGTLLASDEFKAKTTATAGSVDLTDTAAGATNQLISDTFQAILGRQPVPGEFAFFQGRSAASILSLVAGSPEATQVNAANTLTFLDSVAQGSYPTGTLSAQTGGTGGGNNAGQTFTLTNAAVTGIPDTLTGTANNDTFNAAAPGVLNNGDNISGGAGTDTINVSLNAGLANGTGSAGGTILPTLSSVEVVNVTNSSAAFQILDLSSSAGVTNVNVQNVATVGSGVGVQNIAANTVKLGVSNVGDTGVTGTPVLFTFQNAALAGGSDTVDLTVSNVGTATGTTAATAPAITIQGAAGSNSGAETVSLHVNGNTTLANLNVLTTGGGATGLTKLVIDGSGNLAIGNAAAGTGIDFVGAAGPGSIDASKATGNVSIALQAGGNNDAVSFLGGSGNDTISFNGTLDALDSVDGGAGRDTVQATTFQSVVNAANVIKNVEIVNVAGVVAAGGQALDASKITGLDTIVFGGTGANTTTINNAGANFTVGFGNGGSAGGTITVNETNATLGTNTTDVLNVNLGTSTGGGTAQDFGTISAPGVETIAIRTQSNSVLTTQGSDAVAITTDASTKAITVAGNEYLTVTANNGGAAIQTFDASASTGGVNTANVTFANAGATIRGSGAPTSGTVGFTINNVTVANNLVGGTGNDTIVGGSGNDRIDGGAGTGSDSLTGGTGRDTFVLNANGNAANLASPVVDTITDFQLGANGDLLDFTNVPNLPVLNGDVSVALVSSLTGALPAAATANNPAGQAEIIVLDASVAALQAGNAQQLNAALFNLGGSGTYGNVIVAYSNSATGNVRLATAQIVGGDITNVTDVAVLSNITTSAFASGFAGGTAGAGYTGNLLVGGTALGVPGVTFTANKVGFNTTLAADSVEGVAVGGGNDTINATAAQLVGATLQGAAGTDTLNITTTTAVDQTVALNTIEVVNFTGNTPVGTGLTFTTDAATAATINNTSANASTVTLGSANLTFNGGSVVDTVNFNTSGATANGGDGADVFNVTGTKTGTINGGAGTDVLAITAGAAADITGLSLSSVETLDATNNNNTITLSVAQHNAFTTITATGTQTLTLSDAGTLTLNAGIETYNLGNGTNTATLGGTGTQAINGGTGADNIIGSAANLANDTINGNGGIDTLTFTDSAGTFTLATAGGGGAAVTNVENVVLNAGATALTLTAGIQTVSSAAAAGIIQANGNSSQTFTGAGAFTVTDGTGADTITFTGTAGNTVNATGGGINTITLNATNAAADTIGINDGAGTAGVVASANRFVASGFTAANDIVRLDAEQTTAGTASGQNAVIQAANAAGAVTAAATADVLVFNFDAGGAANVLTNDLTGAALLANTGAISTGGAQIGYIVAYDAGNAYLYSYNSATAGANTDVGAGDIALVGTINNVAVGSLQTANFLVTT